MVRVVLFDWDGTLAETRPAVVDAMEHTLAAYGREPWDETKRKYRDTSKSLKENFPNFFGEESVRAYDDYLAYYRVHGMRRIVPAPGAAVPQRPSSGIQSAAGKASRRIRWGGVPP